MQQHPAAGGGVNDAKVLKAQRDLPPGRTYRCPHCGTRIRAGQIHVSREPYPHETLQMLTTKEAL